MNFMENIKMFCTFFYNLSCSICIQRWTWMSYISIKLTLFLILINEKQKSMEIDEK